MNCETCNSNRELRMGHCWNCVEAESIIAEGIDMYNRGLDGTETPAKTALEKVKLLHQKGLLRK